MAVPAQIELRRHYRKLSEKDTDAVVQTVADLIVSYLKRNPGPCGAHQTASATTGPPGTRASASSTGSEPMGSGRNGMTR